MPTAWSSADVAWRVCQSLPAGVRHGVGRIGDSREIAIDRFSDGALVRQSDRVAVEEPLEIRLGFTGDRGRVEKPVSITMRTPGSDKALAAGFLFGEGMVASAADILEVWHPAPPTPDTEYRNVVRVDLQPSIAVDLTQLERHFYTTSSCGVCGKASLEALQVRPTACVSDAAFSIAAHALLEVPDKLRDQQRVFGLTGGLHAAAFFTSNGEILAVSEDVGRHNAMDKLIGQALLAGDLPATASGILVSGRTSFELMQKVVMAGCPLLAGVGAPSSLAVELAEEFGTTLIGFLRNGNFNIYTGAKRIVTV